MLINHKYFHWFYYHKRKQHLFNFSTGLFIWLFLGVTRPFGISNNNFEAYIYLLLNLLLFGSVWIIISYLFDFIFRKQVKKNHAFDLRVLGFKVLFMIHTYLIIRGISCDWECMDFIEYLELWLACGLMIGFCYLTFSLYARYLYFHSMIGQKELASGSIELIGEGKDSLILPMSEIISLKADDNYVDIQMIKEKKTLRSSLSAIENQLEPFSQFIRVHRSYMINFHYVEDYPRKDTILLRQRDERIELPVSKKYQEQVNELFTHPK